MEMYFLDNILSTSNHSLLLIIKIRFERGTSQSSKSSTGTTTSTTSSSTTYPSPSTTLKTPRFTGSSSGSRICSGVLYTKPSHQKVCPFCNTTYKYSIQGCWIHWQVRDLWTAIPLAGMSETPHTSDLSQNIWKYSCYSINPWMYIQVSFSENDLFFHKWNQDSCPEIRGSNPRMGT